MIKSKCWNWKLLNEEQSEPWKVPCLESYYLLNRWKEQNKKTFLDLGCGLGRHSILFAKNNFDTSAFDLSKDAIEKTKEYAESEHLNLKYNVGDMINLPYENEQYDCIFCKNVISHTDTEGIKKIISEIKRVLKPNGECYLTLCSKSAWGYGKDWPIVDANTKIRMDDGPENGIPHFYADYNLITNLFSDFSIILVKHIEDFINMDNEVIKVFHYHVLVKKL